MNYPVGNKHTFKSHKNSLNLRTYPLDFSCLHKSAMFLFISFLIQGLQKSLV